MALNKLELENNIESLLEEMSSIEENPAEARKNFAKQLSTLIDNYIKSATITIPAGIPVQTVPSTGTGSSVSPTTAIIS